MSENFKKSITDFYNKENNEEISNHDFDISYINLEIFNKLQSIKNKDSISEELFNQIAMG